MISGLVRGKRGCHLRSTSISSHQVAAGRCKDTEWTRSTPKSFNRLTKGDRFFQQYAYNDHIPIQQQQSNYQQQSSEDNSDAESPTRRKSMLGLGQVLPAAESKSLPPRSPPPPTQIPHHRLSVVIHLFLLVIVEVFGQSVSGHPRSVQQSASMAVCCC